MFENQKTLLYEKGQKLYDKKNLIEKLVLHKKLIKNIKKDVKEKEYRNPRNNSPLLLLMN